MCSCACVHACVHACMYMCAYITFSLCIHLLMEIYLGWLYNFAIVTRAAVNTSVQISLCWFGMILAYTQQGYNWVTWKIWFSYFWGIFILIFMVSWPVYIFFPVFKDSHLSPFLLLFLSYVFYGDSRSDWDDRES